MSLKRLLNPELGDNDYPVHRPLEGWDEYGDPIEVVPVLQDMSWHDYALDLLDPEGLHAAISQPVEGYDIDHGSLLYAQEQLIEQWAAENALTMTTPAISLPDTQDETICYGMIYRAMVRLQGDMSSLNARLRCEGPSPVSGHVQMVITRCDQLFNITFPDGTRLGEANAQLEKALAGIFQLQDYVDFEVFAPIGQIHETISRATTGKEAVVRVNVNIYGSRAAANRIGQELSSHKIYLQRPDYVRPATPYDNPHVLKLGNIEPQMINQVVETENDKGQENELQKVEEFKKTISEIYDSLTRNQTLVGLEGDDRLRTKLLPHQKQALDFMAQRENGPIPEKFRLWTPSENNGTPCLRHLVTNKPSHLEHPETGGGILADEMGMGKTLSILALLLRTLGAAHSWADEHTGDFHGMSNELNPRRRSRATLIVASSDLMINEWFQEMETHFHNHVCDALTMIKYHGSNRQMNVSKLCDADLVITTYHTLASDYTSAKRSDYANSKNPINDIEWYRLVLDEAHIIRRQSTVLYRTVAEFKARSRWCLTGTPIQNRLEDIGSLFAFLRIIPFNNSSNFRQYIATPFYEGGNRRELAIKRFTLLLDALCLRRTKDLLHLPAQQDRVQLVEFSPEERKQYDQTQKMMMRAAKNQVGGFDQKSTLGLFQVQLQLRILCNHGTYQQPFSWNRRKLHLIDEMECVEASLGRDAEVMCSSCKQTMQLLSGGSMFRRFTENCRHVLCTECIQESMPDYQEDINMSCPICSPLWSQTTQRPQGPYSNHQPEQDTYFRSYGNSSKMEALMRDVQRDVWSTKSIIFSCWTHTLDLISVYLNRASINYRRIDGGCPTAKRKSILHEFATNLDLRVLIMTTGTGAVGLNLATANRVFIVEPQWNPSVENQAIARALRLGQEQRVQVTRYVVNRSVEQDMRSLQDRKLKMAGLAHK